MKRYLLLLTLWSCSILASGQTTARLTGIVLDSAGRTPLELATASIFNEDSTLVGYQLSDKSGKFIFEKIPVRKRLFLNISYVGYRSYSKNLLLYKSDSLTCFLAAGQNDSNNVTVKSIIPVRMNGDTLEINPAAFKMKPNAVVEELLSEVAGVVIWADGTITMNGKAVQNFLVDGKPFLGSTDPRIATQNLPKTAIDKIQVYQEYDRNKIGQQQDKPQDSLLTMNVKLKENSKTGYFGKAGAGYGSTGRYESDLAFQMYDRNSSGGIGGGINNTNKNIQSLQEIFQNNTFRNVNPNLYNTGRFGGNGISKNYSLGGTFTHNFIESTNGRQNNRITGTYTASGSNSSLTDLSLQNRTTAASPQFIRDEGLQNDQSDRHSITLNYMKSLGYSNNMSVFGNVGLINNNGSSMRTTEVKDFAGNLQSTNRVDNSQKGYSDNESVNMNMAHSDNEDPLKGFNLQLSAQHYNSVSERNTHSVFQSIVNPGADTSYNRYYATNSESINVGGTLIYSGFKRLLLGRYNLFGVDLNFSQSFNFNQSSSDSKVSDWDTNSKKYIANNRISNYNKRKIFEYTPSLVLSKGFSRFASSFYRFINFQVNFFQDVKSDNNISSVANRNMDRSFQFTRYEGHVNYQYQKNGKYNYNTSINYSKNFEYPSIDQLYTIVDDINAYDIRIGNPKLKNKVNHRFFFYGNFNTQNPKSLYSVNGNLNAGIYRSLYPVVDSIINDPSGKRTSYYTNASQSNGLNAGFNFNISRKIKKSNIQLMYTGSYNSSELPNYIDGKYTVSESSSLSNQVTLQISLRTLMVLNIGKTFQQYSTTQTGVGLTNFTNNNNLTRLGITLNYPNNFSLSSTVDKVDNSNLDKPTVLWNGFFTCRIMQQQGELKFSAMDILKQYKNIFVSANTYGTSTRLTNGLQQYFLLTFSYYPRKFGKTALKKQEQSQSF